MRKKMLVLIVVFLLLNIVYPVSAIKVNYESGKKSDLNLNNSNSKCYGIVINYNELKNIPIARTQHSISNFVNDLLRQEISVYWSSDNFSAYVKNSFENEPVDTFFTKGSFIIPFTNDLEKNRLITSVAIDYGFCNEVEDRYSVDMFYLSEPLVVDVFPLNYAKVAYNIGDGVHYWCLLCYLDSFWLGGFFDHNIYPDDEIANRLNNNESNLFIWPGANLERGFMGLNGNLRTASHIGASTKIRDFVNNGGGYIGSCYGSGSAGSGTFVPYNLLFHYLRRVPCTLNLGLTANSFTLNNAAGYIDVKIVNMSHPVAFGLNQTQKTYRGHGPVSNWLGKDTHAIAVLENMTNQFQNEDLTRIIPDWLLDKIIDKEIGNPIWITSTFGKGKVVTFGDHPEFPEPYKLDRLVHNAAFYTTCENKQRFECAESISFSEIDSIYNITNNLLLDETNPIFTAIWGKTSQVYELCKELDENEINILNDALELSEEGKIDKNLRGLILGEYRDSYQRWITLFSKSLQKLERVYITSDNDCDFSSKIDIWEEAVLKVLDNCIEICNDLLDMSYEIGEKLDNFVGNKIEKTSLKIIANQRDNKFRKASNFFIQPVMMTSKLYRELWYDYESILCKKQINGKKQSNKDIIYSNIKPDIEYNGRTIYVDDDASARGNGSIIHPYQTIDDALDVSVDGDTIYVFEGLYKGYFAIDKSIKLIGQDKNTTIIDVFKQPRYHVIISVQHVEISGFTITNASKETISCGILLQDSNNVIHDNIIKNCRTGLGFRPKACNNIIKNNCFIENNFAGLLIDEPDSINNTIIDNVFIDNKIHGIYTVNIPNNFSDNSFVNNSITIYSIDDELNITIENNIVNGKPILYYSNKKDLDITGDFSQLILSNCVNISIESLDIDNKVVGIYVVCSEDVEIKNCDLDCGIAGIYIHGSTGVVIENNLVHNGSYYGIILHKSEKNTVKNNEITSNDEGILFEYSDNNHIESNNICHNVVGLSFWAESTKNKILKNNFIGNKENTVDKCRNKYRNNHWDDYKGLNRVLLKNTPYNVPIKKLSNFDWDPAEEPYEII